MYTSIESVREWAEESFGDANFWEEFVHRISLFTSANGNSKEAIAEASKLAEHYETKEQRSAYDGWM